MKDILEQALSLIKNCNNLKELEDIRTSHFGKSGLIAKQMQKLSSMSVEEKKVYGAELNKIKSEIQDLIQNKKDNLENDLIEKQIANEKIDITTSPRNYQLGKIHPIRQATESICEIFCAQGFIIKEGPSIEDDWHNFTALNIDENHPARQAHDTFYMKEEGMLLRTHTSPVQIRSMKEGKLPIRIIAPGRTYRCDSDITHAPMFHQVEALVVEEGLHMGHLKGIIINFIHSFFGNKNINIRFRPSFFPFTEPSAEVDIECKRTAEGIKMEPGGEWLEVLGCGMVHPSVLRHAGIDPDKYRGFALGMGIERMAMLKYGITDLREFFEGDIRWLENFGFSSFDIPSLIKGI